METLTIYLAVNEDGAWATDADSADDALATLIETNGGNWSRVVKLQVTLDLPQNLPVPEASVTVPPGESQPVSIEAE